MSMTAELLKALSQTAGIRERDRARRDERIRALLAQGVPHSRICERLGCSLPTVRRVKQSRGWR